jgi:hypothetical protein
VAESEIGDETVSPAVGLLTVIAAVETTEPTVMSTSTAPFTPFPQHLTCRICAPALALTIALKDVGTMVVEPLSIE